MYKDGIYLMVRHIDRIYQNKALYFHGYSCVFYDGNSKFIIQVISVFVALYRWMNSLSVKNKKSCIQAVFLKDLGAHLGEHLRPPPPPWLVVSHSSLHAVIRLSLMLWMGPP